MTTKPNRPYEEIQHLLESIGGEMKYQPGGGPGGVWILNLHGRTTQVEVRNHTVNQLDMLYIPNVPEPKTWDDYDLPGKLAPEAFWKLVAMFL
jgi:hypothetical protein